MEARLFIFNAESNPTEAARIASETASKIQAKELKLLDVIQSLGDPITDEDATVRAKAIAYLSAVLGALDPKCLSRQHISVITQFLTDRLEDETGLKEGAQGLNVLMNMSRFGSEEAELATTALLKVDLRKHPQGTRFVVLTVLDYLMAKYRDALKKLGDIFLEGIVELVGGEKDPRNLMIIFSVVKVIYVEFDITRHAEAMFDLVYVYYPITFTPPPNDPYGITAQDLKARLRECLAANNLFAEHIFSPLIEKLDSTSQSVKKDVLQTIAACARSYGPSTMTKYWENLWDAIKFEVLNASSPDDEVAEEALLTIRAIAESLAPALTAVQSRKGPIQRYCRAVVKECLELLKEPQQKQSKAAAKIIASVAKADATSHAIITKEVVQPLLTAYGEVDTVPKQRAFLEVFNQALEATIAVYGEWRTTERYPSMGDQFVECKDQLFVIYSKALMGVNKSEVGFRRVALNGLGMMCRIRGFLTENEIGIVVQYLDEVVLEDEVQSSEELRDEASHTLLEISRMKSQLILSVTFPEFLAKLPDSDATPTDTPYILVLEALARLSVERPIFEVLLTRLLNKLEATLKRDSSSTYVRAILSTLLYVIQKKSEEKHADLPSYFDRLVPSLLTKTIVNLICPQDLQGNATKKKHPLADESVLEVSGRIINLIVRALDVEKLKKVLDDALNLFIRCKPSELILERRDEVAQLFRPYGGKRDLDLCGEVDSRLSEHGECIMLFTCIIAGIRREVDFPRDDLLELVSPIQDTITGSSLFRKLALLRLLAILVNKWLNDKKALQKRIELHFKSVEMGQENSVDALRIIFWVAKALTMKSDKYGDEVVTILIGLLRDKKYGMTVAAGFAVLLGEDEFLSKENHVIVRLLTKHRIFSCTVPRLVEEFKASPPETKPNYLVALSNILRNVPSKLLLPEAPKLLPLLLQSLDLPNISVKQATLETLYVTIYESADAIKEHVFSIINRLLAACEVGQVNPPRVRIAALKCLRAFPGTIRDDLLVPYRKTVVKRLLGILDDPKRTVRKEAVDCRARWLGLVEKEDDE